MFYCFLLLFQEWKGGEGFRDIDDCFKSYNFSISLFSFQTVWILGSCRCGICSAKHGCPHSSRGEGCEQFQPPGGNSRVQDETTEWKMSCYSVPYIWLYLWFVVSVYKWNGHVRVRSTPFNTLATSMKHLWKNSDILFNSI